MFEVRYLVLALKVFAFEVVINIGPLRILGKRWVRSKVMRKLARQRAHLLETQQKAEQDLAELEQRLASVHAPLEERLKAYEERIAELQKNLHANLVLGPDWPAKLTAPAFN